ncbi:glycerol-3-phosphate dehydrogenase/oxidase [Desulfovibrio inopinatus]|uniref:glycerol-3-phosphate dehydrogenase/oxidase n=1 Tax=Desulfovibrio inopinatus TaxID=102109 RepID=UPI00068457E3|nr:glycerol-3-phosphate dehydrogenase/oxidase [Desulfovibrio inopinatus]
MDRNSSIDHVTSFDGYWDVVIVGGGATGLGVGVDAAQRGYKTLLLEQEDFAKGTSSRSTKLVHGGVRYLRQGNISLVFEALHERGLLSQNAPHLVSHQAFIVPSFVWWDGPFYGAGLKAYDLLAGKLGLGPSKMLSKEETLRRIPNLEPNGLRGGVVYFDGQFDDSRMAVNLAQTMEEHGGVALNYAKVKGLLKAGRMVDGVVVQDRETGREIDVHARVVVNATGVFVDDLLKMDNPEARSIVAPSQGVHLVFDKEFLPGDTAIMVPHTTDGRVLFAVPWHDKVVVGTTDTPVSAVNLEPRALDEEIDFILVNAARYMAKDPSRSDIKSVFAGLRPLVKGEEGQSTAQLSRDHHLVVSPTGLVTITGGKWTTYRRMAEDTVNHAALVAGLPERECSTKSLKVHGWLKNVDRADPLHVYGSDGIYVKKLMKSDPLLAEKLHANLPYVKAEVVWAVREEMARTVEDVLARRTRALFLDAKASIEAAPETARLIAKERGLGDDWVQEQVAAYNDLAKGYCMS